MKPQFPDTSLVDSLAELVVLDLFIQDGEVRVGVDVYEAGADAHILGVYHRRRASFYVPNMLNAVSRYGQVGAGPGVPHAIHDPAVAYDNIGHVPSFTWPFHCHTEQSEGSKDLAIRAVLLPKSFRFLAALGMTFSENGKARPP